MDSPSEISVSFAWTDVGAVTLERNGMLRFPVIDRIPGVYRLRITDGDRRSAYLGEAVDLKRRAQNYRTPGPTQQTSRRIHALLLRVLTGGGEVSLSITTAGLARSGENAWPLDFERKAARVLVEQAAIALTPGPVENL